MSTHAIRIFTALTALFLAAPALAETVYDDTSPAIRYTGAWNHGSTASNPVLAPAVNGTLSSAQTAGDRAELTFTANRYISLVYTMNAFNWKSAISIDGQPGEVINTRVNMVSALQIQRWQVMRTWKVTPGTHTIAVVAQGAIDGQPAGHTWSDIDAFIVDADAAVPGTTNVNANYPADSSLLEYGGAWNWVTDAANGNRMQSQTPSSSVRFTFYGENAKVHYWASSNRGIAEVTLDGQNMGDLDQFGPGELRAYKIEGLPPGMHTLTLTVSGRSNGMSMGSIVGVNSFVAGR